MSQDKEKTLCSIYCQDKNVPIIGTGRKPENVPFGGFLLVVYPELWDPKIDLQEGILGELYGLIQETLERDQIYFRHQAIKTSQTQISDEVIIFILHRWESQKREEYHVPLSEWKNTLRTILTSPQSQYLVNSDVTRDILVCTHAQRDLCCGRYGYPIYKELSSYCDEMVPSTLKSSIKVWMSNHITGHRAAPVVLDLPAGNYWGYLDTDVAIKLLHQSSLSPEEIRYHFRGGTDLSPAQQLVDREGFIRFGWKWFDKLPQVVETMKTGAMNITVKRGINSIEQDVGQTPRILEIGETHCGFTKHATVFDLLDSS